MRPQTDLRAGRACAAVVALGLTYTVVNDSPLAANAESSATPGQLPARVQNPHALSYGKRVLVDGNLGSAQVGTALALEYAPAGTTNWSVVADGKTSGTGAYRLGAPLQRSGELRVVDAPAQSSVRAYTAATAALTPPSISDASSAELPVRVRAHISRGHTRLDVMNGERSSISGTIRPAAADRLVTLQARDRGWWRTVARTHTGAYGRYQFRYQPSSGSGSTPMRVRFVGDGQNAPAERVLGRLQVFRPEMASWYAGGGTTACGQQLTDSTLGVANKTLPCGTMVTLRYGSHTVTVPVIDRGPYVAGRDFDLTVATKDALGFGSTGEVWATAA